MILAMNGLFGGGSRQCVTLPVCRAPPNVWTQLAPGTDAENCGRFGRLERTH